MTLLVTVAHGTRDGEGNQVAVEITRGAASRCGRRAVASYVELCEPSFADVMLALEEPAVVVPLLLSTGFHVRVDLPEAVAAARTSVALGPPLGPDPALAEAQAARLREAGAVDGQPVMLVAAGSRDPAAQTDLASAVAHLEAVWDGGVQLATLTGPGPRLDALLTPEHAVSPYLLASGHFAHRARTEALAVAADVVVADVVGAHPAVLDLVAQRAG